jgi:hypothetical protein
MSETSHLLPRSCLNSKITYEHDGQYHKGYRTQESTGNYCFSYKSHINKKKANWSVPLPNLTSNWHELCLEGVLIPGHKATSFVRKSTASFVSTTNLVWEFLRSLLTALADTHPDREIWMQSFWEEKDGIEAQNTYDKITLAQYRMRREKDPSRAIPTMCVLTIKPDKKMNPHQAKLHIAVLGIYKDRIWSKSEKYAPVLRPDTMQLIISMAVEQWRMLNQGDSKNAFCQGILPWEKITFVKPPIINPDAKKDKCWLLKRTLYGLCCSPCHWYTKIKTILQKLGLRQNAYNPCLFIGNIINPSDPSDSPSTVPLTLGLYMENFIYFSADDAVKVKF